MAPARAECTASSAPLRSIEGFAVVSATIGRRPVSFLLDTGAEAHLIRPEAQTVLDLAPMPGSVPVYGTGGTRPAPLVALDQVWLGTMRLDRAVTPVLPLPVVPAVTPLLAGLLGEPLLDQFDLLLDAPSGRLGLSPAGDCGPPLFPSPLATVDLTITADRQILLPVSLNGVTLAALLDTGSRATLLTEPAARRLGIDPRESANTARGVDGELVPVGHARARTLAVGGDVRRNAPISIAPLQTGAADLLLGFDYLRTRRCWISAATRRMVIALPDAPTRPAASARGSRPPPPPGRARR